MVVDFDWEPDPDLDWEPDPDLDWEPDPDLLAEDRVRGQAEEWLLPGRQVSAADEPGRFIFANPAAEALAGFLSGLDTAEFDDWWAMAMLGALFLRRWLRDHQPPPPPLLRAFLVLLAVLLAAVAREPREPGRPEDTAIRGPSAPLVRAHSILTAAPPVSPASVLAGAPA